MYARANARKVVDPAYKNGFFMAILGSLVKEIEDALDELRDATVNQDITRADKIKKVLLDFLEPEGYTLVEDPKKIYVLKAISEG